MGQVELKGAEALTVGQYMLCAACARWVGPSDLHRLTVEDAVICWQCGDVGLLGENLMGETVFTYSEATTGRDPGDRGTGPTASGQAAQAG